MHALFVARYVDAFRILKLAYGLAGAPYMGGHGETEGRTKR